MEFSLIPPACNVPIARGTASPQPTGGRNWPMSGADQAGKGDRGHVGHGRPSTSALRAYAQGERWKASNRKTSTSVPQGYARGERFFSSMMCPTRMAPAQDRHPRESGDPAPVEAPKALDSCLTGPSAVEKRLAGMTERGALGPSRCHSFQPRSSRIKSGAGSERSAAESKGIRPAPLSSEGGFNCPHRR